MKQVSREERITSSFLGGGNRWTVIKKSFMNEALFVVNLEERRNK